LHSINSNIYCLCIKYFYIENKEYKIIEFPFHCRTQHKIKAKFAELIGTVNLSITNVIFGYSLNSKVNRMRCTM